MSPGGAPEISTEPPRRAEEELGQPRSPHHKGRIAVTLAALGVVFGDIGTSPLYAMHTVFAIDRELRPTEAAVYGIISLVFWAITLVVTVPRRLLQPARRAHRRDGIAHRALSPRCPNRQRAARDVGPHADDRGPRR